MRLIFSLFLTFTGILSYAQGGSLPISLSLPMDADTINETEPTFVWQANLSTIQNDPRFTLNLTLVKLDANQTATEGIIENMPIQMYANLLSNTIQYSSSAPALERNVWYAWQLILYYNGLEVQQSEVWKFILADEDNLSPNYYKLRTIVDNSFLEVTDDFLFVTTNEPGTFELIGEISGKGITPQKIYFKELVDGEEINSETSSPLNESRFFKCDLGDLDLHNGTYRVQWDANSTKHFVFFIKKT